MANYNNTSQHTVIAAQPEETAAERFTRDYESMGKLTVPAPGETDDRKDRQLDQQDENRQARLYVNREDGTSATGKTSDELDELMAAADADHSNPVTP